MIRNATPRPLPLLLSLLAAFPRLALQDAPAPAVDPRLHDLGGVASVGKDGNESLIVFPGSAPELTPARRR